MLVVKSAGLDAANFHLEDLHGYIKINTYLLYGSASLPATWLTVGNWESPVGIVGLWYMKSHDLQAHY